MLEGANIKLYGTVSDIGGKSARSILGVPVPGGSIDSSKYDGVLPSHIDELDRHIRELDGQVDSHMKPEDKRAAGMIKGITDIADASVQIMISMIGTDMGRFPTDGHMAS